MGWGIVVDTECVLCKMRSERERSTYSLSTFREENGDI